MKQQKFDGIISFYKRISIGAKYLHHIIIFGLLIVGTNGKHSYPIYQEENPYTVFIPLVLESKSDLIPELLNQIDITNLAYYASDLVELFGPRHQDFYSRYTDNQCTLESKTYPNHNLIRSSKHVFHFFEDLGLEPYKEWLPDWYGSYNVVAQKDGSEYPEVYLEIGAHIDTKDKTPGASDNASGVAVLMEMARILKDFPNSYSWRFVTFVGEEENLVGSRYHIDLVKREGEIIKAGLIMDGIGWSEIAPEHMNCLWDNADDETRRISNLFNQVRTEYDIDINWRLCEPDGQWSDNYAYWEGGFPAVLSIGGFPYDDPNYHKCTDTMNNINMQNVYKTALQNLAVLLILDEEEFQPDLYQPEQFEITIPTDGTSH